MIWGIHYFITKLKTKIDVIPRSCFNVHTTSKARNYKPIIICEREAVALEQWLKPPARKIEDRGFFPRSGIQVLR